MERFKRLNVKISPQFVLNVENMVIEMRKILVGLIKYKMRLRSVLRRRHHFRQIVLVTLGLGHGWLFLRKTSLRAIRKEKPLKIHFRTNMEGLKEVPVSLY